MLWNSLSFVSWVSQWIEKLEATHEAEIAKKKQLRQEAILQQLAVFDAERNQEPLEVSQVISRDEEGVAPGNKRRRAQVLRHLIYGGWNESWVIKFNIQVDYKALDEELRKKGEETS
jgi:hypothetical protein